MAPRSRGQARPGPIIPQRTRSASRSTHSPPRAGESQVCQPGRALAELGPAVPAWARVNPTTTAKVLLRSRRTPSLLRPPGSGAGVVGGDLGRGPCPRGQGVDLVAYPDHDHT